MYFKIRGWQMNVNNIRLQITLNFSKESVKKLAD